MSSAKFFKRKMLILSCVIFLAFLEASKRSQNHTTRDLKAKMVGTASSPVVLDDSEEEVKSLAVVLGRKGLYSYIDLTMNDSIERKDLVAERVEYDDFCLFSKVYSDFEFETEAPTSLIKASFVKIDAKLETEEKVSRDQNKPITRNGLKIARKRAASMQPPQEPLSKKQKIDTTLTISTTYPMGFNWTTHPIQIGCINRLVLFNLAHTTGIPELVNMFKVYGNIEEIEYVDDSLNSRTNIAFIRFTNKLALINAISNMRNKVYSSRCRPLLIRLGR